MRQQCNLGHHAEPAHFLGGHRRDLDQLLRGRIVVHVGVGDEQRTLGQHQGIHAAERLRTLLQPDHALDVAQVVLVDAHGAAEHGVGLALTHQRRADQCRTAPHLELGVLDRYPVALHDLMIELPVLAVAWIALGVDHLEVATLLDTKAQPRDSGVDHVRAPDQDRPRELLVDDDLYGAQDLLFLTLGIDHALGGVPGGTEQRLHHEA